MRGLFLLAALAELLVIVPLVALSMLPLWALAPALLAVGWAVLFARAGVRAEQALVRAGRRRQADLARRRTSAPAAARPDRARGTTAATASTRPVAPTAAQGVKASEPAAIVTLSEPDLVGSDSPVVEPVAARVVEVPATAVLADDVMVPIVDEDDLPLTWDPVPVPRPTYTMKAKAQRAEVAPADVTPDPVAVARESDESSYDERRVAGA